MTLIGYVKNMIEIGFDGLDGDYGAIGVDFLNSEVGSYSIEEVPGEIIVKQYSDGGSVRRFNFIFTSREFYSGDTNQNMENSKFYESLAEWMEIKTKKNDFPIMDGKRKAQSIKASSGGFVVVNEFGEAQYQIQCSLNYYKEK